MCLYSIFTQQLFQLACMYPSDRPFQPLPAYGHHYSLNQYLFNNQISQTSGLFSSCVFMAEMHKCFVWIVEWIPFLIIVSADIRGSNFFWKHPFDRFACSVVLLVAPNVEKGPAWGFSNNDEVFDCLSCKIKYVNSFHTSKNHKWEGKLCWCVCVNLICNFTIQFSTLF